MRAAPRASAAAVYDPGRERRAEQRARELLRSCVNEEEWAMYRDLGFIRVWGVAGRRPGRGRRHRGAPYAYLIYPHRPIVAYLPQTRRLLGEYCVEFPDETGRTGQRRLPDSDDVLAKWMALTGDERRADRDREHAPPGPPARPRPGPARPRRLAQWERSRMRAAPRGDATASRRAAEQAGGAPAPLTARYSARAMATLDPKHRSRALTEGPERAAARAYLKGIGYDDEALAQAARRGRQHLDRDDAVQLPPARARARRSRRASARPAGRRWSSTRSRSPTGSRWAPPGMRASLPSREVIADSIELVVRRATCSTR